MSSLQNKWLRSAERLTSSAKDPCSFNSLRNFVVNNNKAANPPRIKNETNLQCGFFRNRSAGSSNHWPMHTLRLNNSCRKAVLQRGGRLATKLLNVAWHDNTTTVVPHNYLYPRLAPAPSSY